MTGWFGGRCAPITITVAALLPLGCAPMAEEGALGRVDPALHFSEVSRDYPDMGERYSRASTVSGLAAVRDVEIGQNRQEVRVALGEPALINSDGSWEYHIALPLTGRDTLICQYLVSFDAGDRVRDTAWRRPQCTDLISSAAS